MFLGQVFILKCGGFVSKTAFYDINHILNLCAKKLPRTLWSSLKLRCFIPRAIINFCFDVTVWNDFYSKNVDGYQSGVQM